MQRVQSYPCRGDSDSQLFVAGEKNERKNEGEVRPASTAALHGSEQNMNLQPIYIRSCYRLLFLLQFRIKKVMDGVSPAMDGVNPCFY